MWEHGRLHLLRLSVGASQVNVTYDPVDRHPKVAQLPYLIHSHSGYEVHLCPEGHGGWEFLVGRDRLDVHPDQAVIIAPGVYHTAPFHKPAWRTFRYYPERGPLADRLRIAPPCRVLDRAACAGLLELCREEALHQRPGGREKLEALFKAVLIDLLRELDAGADWDGPEPPLEAAVLLDDYFPLQHHQKYSKAELAAKLGVSERQLERTLHSVYGMSFHEKVRETRFETARILLNYYGCPIKEVSEFLGYDCQSSFFRAYKKYFGCTPAASKGDRSD